MQDWALPQRYAPPVRLDFRWQEATPATFEVRFPSDFLPSYASDFAALAAELEAVLEYGRAAGIKARLRCIGGPNLQA